MKQGAVRLRARDGAQEVVEVMVLHDDTTITLYPIGGTRVGSHVGRRTPNLLASLVAAGLLVEIVALNRPGM